MNDTATINQSSTKINYTSEYGTFHFLRGNRDLNEGKVNKIIKSVNDGLQFFKYWPYFNLSSGFGFSDSHYTYVYSDSDVGSRLCFESEEKCKYAATQFLSIYEEFLTIKK